MTGITLGKAFPSPKPTKICRLRATPSAGTPRNAPVSIGGAARIYLFAPGRVFSSGKRLLSRAHRVASSFCKNLFLKAPRNERSAKKVLASQALRPRNIMPREAFAGAFPPSAGGMFEARQAKTRLVLDCGSGSTQAEP
jgi:hypothetical protein